MKRLAILAFLGLIIAIPAFAQTTGNIPMTSTSVNPTEADKVREEANALISAVRQQRDANADQLAQAMAQIAKLQKALDATKIKPEVKK